MSLQDRNITWISGEALTAVKLNRMSDAILEGLNLAPSSGNYYSGPGGQSYIASRRGLTNFRVFLAGEWFDGLNDKSKNLIKVNRDDLEVTEESGTMPDPFPPGIEFYEKNRSPLDIHVPWVG